VGYLRNGVRPYVKEEYLSIEIRVSAVETIDSRERYVRAVTAEREIDAVMPRTAGDLANAAGCCLGRGRLRSTLAK
jgi:hypothetical protein